MSNKERFDAVHDAFKDVRDMIACLDKVGRDLECVGNNYLAERIYGPCDRLSACLKTLRDAYAADIHEGFQEAQQMSATILKATLAGIEIATPPQGEK